MTPIRLSDETRYIGPPKDWNSDIYGECDFLSVTDILIGVVPYMVSAWKPSKEELENINAGGAIHLWIVGSREAQHPVVSLSA